MIFEDKYYFLSNMYKSPVTYGGDRYTCVEAAYQAAKCKYRSDRGKFKGINGYEAKRLSKTIATRGDWFNINLKVMEDLVRDKFRNNRELVQKLIAKGNIELVEDNYWRDDFWGRYKGLGENHLGIILMKIRSELVYMDNEANFDFIMNMR